MGFNPAEKTLNRAAGLKNVGKTTRRVFLRTLALATAAFGLARYRTSRGAAAAADTVGAGPFTWASLAQRGATITDALGRPDLAGRILSDCGLPGTCDGQAVVSSLTEDDLSLDRWNTFFEIFPSGQALARIAYLLSNISWISPRYAIDPLVAGGLYVTNSADQPLGISLLPVSSLPITLPSW